MRRLHPYPYPAGAVPIDEERTQNAVQVFLCFFYEDVINTSPVVVLLVAGSLVPAWRSLTLSLIRRIWVRRTRLLVGALPGVVPSVPTSEAGNLPSDVGFDSTAVGRGYC